jgi:hypothetical protein
MTDQYLLVFLVQGGSAVAQRTLPAAEEWPLGMIDEVVTSKM